MRKIVPALLAAAVLAAPLSAARRDTPDVKLSKLLAGRVAGKPTDCIPLDRATQSEVVPGLAIVYHLGGTLWVNRPSSGAESLHGDEILVTRTISTQLCRMDMVRLIDRRSRIPTGTAILGDFIPYRRAK